MTDKNNGGSGRPGISHGDVGKTVEGARGGLVLPSQTKPMDITNQVGGLPPAGDGGASGTGTGGGGSTE